MNLNENSMASKVLRMLNYKYCIYDDTYDVHSQVLICIYIYFSSEILLYLSPLCQLTAGYNYLM